MNPPSSSSPARNAAPAQDGELMNVILAELKRSAWMPFSRFMELALYAPRLGYYTRGTNPFGADGDFTTAPESSPLFARALARQVADAMKATSPSITELGPGSGALAVGLLTELEALGSLPERYVLVDISAPLRERQRCALEAGTPHLLARCTWREDLPGALDGVTLGNEVLDALPVDLVVRRGANWLERGVVIGDSASDALAWADRDPDAALLGAIDRCLPVDTAWPEGYLTEIARPVHDLIAAVATRMRRGVALFVDYGFPASEYFHPQRMTGTLMAHSRHRAHGSVLLAPGLQDLTVHVEFSSIARVVRGAGCEVLGYTSQARFLLNCGIADLIGADPSDAARWLRQTNALQRLLSEAEMGELFKVFAFGRGVEAPLLGFCEGDRSDRL